LIGTEAKETLFRSWANGTETRMHGPHLDGFRDALRGAKIRPSAAMIHVIMNRPEFAGPTRGKLRNPEVRQQVREALKPTLRKWVEQKRRS
jgi:DNA gyrase/topoisomerase IV subunit B